MWFLLTCEVANNCIFPFQVRGVGTGGIVSTAFCLLYKLFTLKMTRKQVMGLITHTDSPYIRALGFMYIRYDCLFINAFLKLLKNSSRKHHYIEYILLYLWHPHQTSMFFRLTDTLNRLPTWWTGMMASWMMRRYVPTGNDLMFLSLSS